MIDGAPEIEPFAVDSNKDLVHVLSPQREGLAADAALTQFGSEHRSDADLPEPDSFVAYADAPFEQQVLNLTERQRIVDVHHHREADHLRRTVEATERISHPPGL